MWRKNSWSLGIAFLVVIIFSFSAAGLKINEVMPHSNNSLGNEWIELYNNESSNLTLINFRIGDLVSNDTINLSIAAGGFGIIVDSSINCSSINISNESCFSLATIGSGLNDDNETLYLYDNSSNLIDSFSWNSSIKAEGRSWQWFNNSWQKCSPTPGAANFCNQTINQTANNTNTTINNTNKEKITIDLDFDRIYCREAFDVDLEVDNLERGDYDVKIELVYDEKKAEIYDDKDDDWKSSTYYINDVMDEGGDASFSLNITREYEGDAEITVKIRKTDSSYIVASDSFDVAVHKREDVKKTEEGNSTSLNNSSLNQAVYLNKKEYESEDSNLDKIVLISFIAFSFVVIVAIFLFRNRIAL